MTDWISDPQVCAAARLLKQQAVIAYPTESVWGLGCDPGSLLAVEKLLQLKDRNKSKGLILIAASVEQFAPFLVGLEPDALQRFQTPQLKPTTWLVPNNGSAPEWISGGHDTLALARNRSPARYCPMPIIWRAAGVHISQPSGSACRHQRRAGCRHTLVMLLMPVPQAL